MDDKNKLNYIGIFNISVRYMGEICWVFVKHLMTHKDPKVQLTLPRQATIVHDDPTKVKSHELMC